MNAKSIKRTIRKIANNLSSKLQKDKVFDFILKNKYPFIFVIILLLFISKNIILLGTYSSEISSLEEQVKNEQITTKQLKDDMKYYNTDEFVYRYAMENLNMRPTKESNLIHIDVLPPPIAEETEEKEKNNENKNEQTTEGNDSQANEPAKEQETSDENADKNTDKDESANNSSNDKNDKDNN